jgi:methionyl-tRNA formyltransferase
LVDHGPIIAQEKLSINETEDVTELAKKLFAEGGRLLAENIPAFLAGKIIGKEQDHSKATFTRKVRKEDGEIVPGINDRENYNKYRAYIDWPGVFFFRDGRRIKVTKARFEKGLFMVEKVIPEGKKETTYENFLNTSK